MNIFIYIIFIIIIIIFLMNRLKYHLLNNGLFNHNENLYI